MNNSRPFPQSIPIPGGRWWRVDFHTHTPHSGDYSDKSVTHREWLFAYMQAEIDCVCVTDHNGGNWIDALKSEYETMSNEAADGGLTEFRQLAIFPGVELSTADDIHLLAIFDPTASSADVTALLIEVGMNGGDYGDEKLQLRDGVKTILENVTLPNFNCVFVPAHVNQGKGLIEDGNARMKDDVLRHPSIFALECGWSKEPDWNVQLAEKKGNKVFSTVFGSDSHCLAEVGRRTTWVRMEEPTLDALKIALMDGTISTLEYKAGEEIPGPPLNQWIREISLEKVKFIKSTEAMVLKLNPGLNTIIGGRGTGKSTLLELVREALYRSAEFTNKELKDQHELLMEGFLKGQDDAIVSVEYGKHGKNFKMVLNGPHPPQRAELFEEDDGHYEPLEISLSESREMFPLRIYSQKELYGFRNGTARLLTEIDADPSINAREHQDKVDQLEGSLLKSAVLIHELKQELAKLPDLKVRGQELGRQIKVLEDSGHRETLQNYNLRRKQASELKRWNQGRDGLIAELADLAEALKISALELTQLPEHQEENSEEAIEGSAGELVQAYQKQADELLKISTVLQEAEKTWEASEGRAKWISTAQKSKKVYEDLIEQLDDKTAANPTLYGQLVQQRNTLEEQLKEGRARDVRLAKEEGEKIRVIKEMESLREELSDKRAEFVNDLFAGREDLKFTLVAFGDRESANISLREVLQRPDTTFPEIEELLGQLYANGSPSLVKIAEMKQALKDAAVKEEAHDAFGARIGKNLCKHLAKRTTQDWVRLDSWYPPDSMRIRIRRGNHGKPDVDLSKASPGQVATAILAFLLAYGEQPLILDQPEDDLDNRMIFDVIVEELRRNKSKRQVILVTHNPNLVVNGNADMIFPLDASGGPTSLLECGTLQNPQVRAAVCQIMEGGERALEQRFRRMISKS